MEEFFFNYSDGLRASYYQFASC